jgi:hypothetical protein
MACAVVAVHRLGVLGSKRRPVRAVTAHGLIAAPPAGGIDVLIGHCGYERARH